MMCGWFGETCIMQKKDRKISIKETCNNQVDPLYDQKTPKILFLGTKFIAKEQFIKQYKHIVNKKSIRTQLAQYKIPRKYSQYQDQQQSTKESDKIESNNNFDSIHLNQNYDQYYQNQENCNFDYKKLDKNNQQNQVCLNNKYKNDSEFSLQPIKFRNLQEKEEYTNKSLYQSSNDNSNNNFYINQYDGDEIQSDQQLRIPYRNSLQPQYINYEVTKIQINQTVERRKNVQQFNFFDCQYQQMCPCFFSNFNMLVLVFNYQDEQSVRNILEILLYFFPDNEYDEHENMDHLQNSKDFQSHRIKEDYKELFMDAKNSIPIFIVGTKHEQKNGQKIVVNKENLQNLEHILRIIKTYSQDYKIEFQEITISQNLEKKQIQQFFQPLILYSQAHLQQKKQAGQPDYTMSFIMSEIYIKNKASILNDQNSTIYNNTNNKQSNLNQSKNYKYSDLQSFQQMIIDSRQNSEIGISPTIRNNKYSISNQTTEKSNVKPKISVSKFQENE
ncbi:hypothetical protein PPERSA_04406 [Pseudocohnilembus persalinus]|uniref:P-loop containing nucleoside triphosphate hydrolase n=1 Tax=Pseudocohnilembus persalinus TaxID=266149 RepID=A0A0V0QQM7_PSEPJ|nr:hypothetical protein PPERSA_04406 [Pseudocohnilembus persalinus]|eukprot:KRX04591.1 hypothetical protein PPERSA_04406 [Pseudocohnilembus persalinus]